MVVLILLLTASRRALDSPDRMVRRMSKRRRSIFSPSLENSSMPERDASADRAHALPVDAHQRRHGAPGRVHAQPCDLPLEVTRVRALASRHGTIATVTPCSTQSTLWGACSSRSLAQPMSRCRQRRTPSRSYGRPRSPHLAHRSMSVFCQIFVGRFGVSFSPFERLFLGRFGFGQSCGLSVIA